MQQLLEGFVDEGTEICERATKNLLELEKQPSMDAGTFDDLARGLHTLKGSAATLGLDELADLAHKMEDAALPLRGLTGPFPMALADGLLRTVDLWLAHLKASAVGSELPDLKPSFALMESLAGASPQSGEEGAQPGDAQPPAPEENAGTAPAVAPGGRAMVLDVERSDPEQSDPTEAKGDDGSWRVATRQVIGLLDEVERLRELRLRVEERRRDLERALVQLSRLGMQSETAESRALLMGVSRALSSDGEEAADIVTAMEEALKSITTVPVRTVLEPLRRAVRDLCKQTGKLVRLSVVGAEVSLDRRVLESLRGPLVHLVRNAVDHGMEAPEVREARGKHREGALVIRVEQQGNMLFIEVSDDGAGLDLARVREVAVQRGLALPEEIAAMQPAQLSQLIFRPGFSTRTAVTEVSGRGVGLDVVQRQIEALRGHVEVLSVSGQGTRFILSLPTGLGSSPVLVVRCGEHVLGIPMIAVESSRPARTRELRIGRNKVQLEHREQLLPVLDLGAVMGLRQAEVPTDGQPVLVLQSQGRRVALTVDEVVADRELNIRPLPVEVRDIAAYQGAATMARGELVLIVRADWLVLGDKRAGADGVGVTRRALVVDDSLTARALHRTALESGGYLVHTASNARQALELLKHSAYDAMVSDIGMEEMDGYELTQAVRLRHEVDGMPVILVSARDSGKDRERGLAVGADGFLSKKDCASGRLLSEVAAAIARRKGASA
jgi:chemotaxis protein histidine kinase CheA/ActR/RegA family two-component response regulator